MTGSTFDIVEAIHPHWIGYLRLSNTDDFVAHDSVGSTGRYVRGDGKLTIAWDGYAPDLFLELSGVYVHQAFLDARPELASLVFARFAGHSHGQATVAVGIPGTDHEVRLRPRTSDVTTYGQVFIRPEYESDHLPKAARAIVDLGANIGLATMFFGLKYPRAEILAVEPDVDNFALLTQNIASLGDRARAKHAAAWTRDGVVNLHRENEAGQALGAWGVQVSERPGNTVTPCRTLATLLNEAGFARVDILKIDIEGAELELFSDGVAEWLPKVDLIIVETHERFRPGSDAAVRDALRPMFDERPGSGENLFFRRKIVVRF